ncbi:unnamed protein product [Rotaria sordida]|uniref:F-box domain-containing protein n=1 Tax=Rotaria sordida TaxID=392033 RepID=A0A819J6W7_9BILA|nr:unnamed protein product [Rotaria sordida]CAF1262132.1 unnamed protein product [Rotaria sordida]CAF1308607.1 unnamed protein product [Rotaria sordida]CAF1534148.1 unnamed protein product [Rotaria sordida]CAF3896953.1 unnamed protein product [Rotaria sordida]
MISRLEILPNEIIISIFYYLSWNDILISFWSLNSRFNSLICSNFSINQSTIVIAQPGLSYHRLSSTLLPLIHNSSSLISSIRRIHLDGTNSNSYDLIYQCCCYNKNTFTYPNLKSLILNQCNLSESLIDNLSLLIEYQLDELTLIVDTDINKLIRYKDIWIAESNQGNNHLFF